MKREKSPTKLVALLLSVLMIVSVLPMSAFAASGLDDTKMPPDTYLISETEYDIAPGVKETQLIMNDAAGTRQNMGYAVTVEMGGSASIIASYKDQNPTSYGLQTVRDQARAAERKRGVNVVAGTNGMIFNMANGAPTGLLTVEGKEYNPVSGYPYFAILKDGTAVIRDPGVSTDDVQEAIGLWAICVRDGKNIITDNSGYSADDNPRTAVGIKADGSVVLMVADGRQAPKACGMSWSEVMDIMVGMGCVIAGHLDGGGSTTYVSKHEGQTELAVTNSPSDGVERAVSTALLVVSSATPDGEFHHATLSPNNEVYTPGSTIQFKATGVDSAGGSAPLPEDGAFALVDDSFGSVTSDGEFVSNGKTGTVTVNYVTGGAVAGSVSVEIQDPDEIYFASDEVSLGFEAETDFGLTMRYKGKNVNFKAGDIEWTAAKVAPGTEEDGKDCLDEIGTFNGNILTTADGVTITANVTATYKNTGISSSIRAIIGMLPTIVWDFEDPDYYTIDTENSNFKTGNAGRGARQSAEVVSIYDDYPVRFGTRSLKLGYDFTQMTQYGTDGSYFGMTQTVPIPGMPTGLGVWVYAPEGTDNFWLRGYIYSGTGALTPVDFTLQTSQATEDTPPGIYWSGWKYCEADLTNIQGPYQLAKGFTFRLMYVPGINMGSQTKGEIYLDNLQFVYGANVDDVDEPVIDSMFVSDGLNDVEIVSGETVFNQNKVTLKTNYHDVQNKYTTGVEVVRMYVDGKEVTHSDEYFESFGDGVANLYEINLPNGWHGIKLFVRDKFGNEKTETRYFKVDGEADYPTVYAEAQSANPMLCTNYSVDIKTNVVGGVASANIEFALKNNLFGAPTVIFAEGYADSTYAYNAKTNTIAINAVRSADAAVSEEDVTIATVTYAISPELAAGSKFVYEVHGEFTTDSELDYMPVFSSGETSVDVAAKYSVSAEAAIIGTATVIGVKDELGNKAEGISVYKEDGTLLGVTDGEGIITLENLSDVPGSVNVYAEKDGYRSFAYKIDILSVPADMNDSSPLNIISNAVADSSSQKNISWLVNPLTAADKAVLMLAEKAAFDKDGDAAFTAYNGETKVLNLAATKNAVRSNNVKLTGLKANTEYCYKVGDGETWSEVYTFTLKPVNRPTSFYIVGDIQAEDLTNTKNMLADLSAAGKYDFGIQTGDSVDNAGNYNYWTELLKLYDADSLGSFDTVHVFGNHEFEGDLAGTNSAAIYGRDSNVDQHGSCYSVVYGNVYVAVINYTQNEAQLKAALEWLIEDAKSSNATWKLLTMHQPAYYTNPTGGNGYINRLVPAAAEAAGIDFVFSGHDHSYARTQPMIGGEVNEDGVVYFICGSTGEKSYDIVDNDAFNFACLDDEFDIAYLTVETTNTELTITAHSRSVDENGASDRIIDSYTKTKTADCTEHVYSYDGTYLYCAKCGYAVPVGKYSGIVTDTATDNKMYLYLGQPVKGAWQTVGEDIYYLDENGFVVTGKFTVTESVVNGRPIEGSENNDVIFGGKEVSLEYTFDDDGKLIRGAVVNANNTKYYVYAGVIQFGWHNIDGDWYCFDGVRNKAIYGKVLTGLWTRNYTRYECDSEGKLVKGFVYKDEGGTKYFLGSEYVTGWNDIDGYTWGDEKGQNYTRVQGRFYFDPESGYMVTENTEIDGVMHYFNEDGTTVNGLVKLDDGMIFCVDGVAVSGWQTIDGERFYFDPANNNYAVVNGSIEQDGVIYSFNDKGEFAHNGAHEDIDGDGVCDECDLYEYNFISVILGRFFDIVDVLIRFMEFISELM